MWNTTNYPTDKERIRDRLSLPANRLVLNQLQAAMDSLEREYPDGILAVQAKLDRLDQLEVERDAAQADPNYNLKKADVLEWFDNNKTAGYDLVWEKLIRDIATTLDVESLINNDSTSNNWQQGYLGRS